MLLYSRAMRIRQILFANTRATSLLMLSVFVFLTTVQTLSLAHDIIHSDIIHSDYIHSEHESEHEETEFCQILDTVGASKVLIDSAVELNLISQPQKNLDNFVVSCVYARLILKNQARAPPLRLSTT